MSTCPRRLTLDGTTPSYQCDDTPGHKGKHWHTENGITYRWADHRSWVDLVRTPAFDRPLIMVNADDIERILGLITNVRAAIDIRHPALDEAIELLRMMTTHGSLTT